MTKYRIEHRYPCYANGGCIPYDGYFVQKLEEGFFVDKWVDIKGFGDRKKAEECISNLSYGDTYFSIICFELDKKPNYFNAI